MLFCLRTLSHPPWSCQNGLPHLFPQWRDCMTCWYRLAWCICILWHELYIYGWHLGESKWSGCNANVQLLCSSPISYVYIEQLLLCHRLGNQLHYTVNWMHNVVLQSFLSHSNYSKVSPPNVRKQTWLTLWKKNLFETFFVLRTILAGFCFYVFFSDHYFE